MIAKKDKQTISNEQEKMYERERIVIIFLPLFMFLSYDPRLLFRFHQGLYYSMTTSAAVLRRQFLQSQIKEKHCFSLLS